MREVSRVQWDIVSVVKEGNVTVQVRSRTGSETTSEIGRLLGSRVVGGVVSSFRVHGCDGTTQSPAWELQWGDRDATAWARVVQTKVGTCLRLPMERPTRKGHIVPPAIGGPASPTSHR